MVDLPPTLPFHWFQTVAGLVPTLIFVGIYVPAAGHGFLSDDFRWVVQSRIHDLADVVRLFRITDGFYRPLVSLTFGLDRLAFGTDPRPYAWTNVGLALTTALLLRRLSIALGLLRGSGTLAASLWLLNFHGINMAVLWICGRTSLLVACAGVASAIFIVKRRMFCALGCLVLALFSKEEALTLPVVFTVWLSVLGDSTSRARLRAVALWLLGSVVITAVYLSLRSSTGAMTPATAPSYYQLTFAPSVVGRNALEYMDRAASISAIVVLVGLIVLWPKPVHLDNRMRRVLVCAGLWLVGAYGITVFLPVRSSLYAVVPSIGACVGAAVLLEAGWTSADRVHRDRALWIAVLVPVCLLPVYYVRAQGSVPLANFSTQVLHDIGYHTRHLPDEAAIVIVDDRTTRINVATAFGALLNEAILLETGRHLRTWLEPPRPGEEGSSPPCASCVALRLRVVRGRIVADDP